MLDMPTKWCGGCAEEKPHDEFYRCKRGDRYGLAYRCKTCAKEVAKAHIQKLPLEQRRKYMMKRRYGIGPEELNRMLKTQRNRCAICRDPFDGKSSKNVHIDHCHDNNVIRGVLCVNCNISLGMLQHDPKRIQKFACKAVKYLKQGG